MNDDERLAARCRSGPRPGALAAPSSVRPQRTYVPPGLRMPGGIQAQPASDKAGRPNALPLKRRKKCKAI